ncbi:hypothetical protein FRB95_001452 [Tulasnella sp. JGI-2019a]|nr:hypothetical protein FRB95_001452 [Tulasnella sp. JGI-2019a]
MSQTQTLYLQHERMKPHPLQQLPTTRILARWVSPRRQIPLLLVSLLGIFIIAGIYYSPQFDFDVRLRWRPDTKPETLLATGSYNVSHSVLGHPTANFKDNLRPDLKYITGFAAAGYTNDFMTYVNIVLLAQFTRRIPIIPPFSPSHIGYDEESIPFGDVFDVLRMAEELKMPVLEWRDVKKDIETVAGPQSDKLGCWTCWAQFDDGPRAGKARENRLEGRLGLDISYTKVPASAKMPQGNVDLSAWELAKLGFHPGWLAGTQENQPIDSEGPLKHRMPPDEQLLCFDFLYYVHVIRPWEWDEEYSPAWHIASKMHFAPRMVQMANGHLMRLFDVQREADIPLFISIHVRHGDFKGACGTVPVNDCFAPLAVISRRVQEVQDELASAHPGLNNGLPLKVLLTSDEQGEAWWNDVRNLGWYFIDHGPRGEDTAAKHGKWYPPLLDSVFQSMGTGFVGTDRSTMSQIARRRVQDWQGGAVRDFRWGYPGADDH